MVPRPLPAPVSGALPDGALPGKAVRDAVNGDPAGDGPRMQATPPAASAPDRTAGALRLRCGARHAQPAIAWALAGSQLSQKRSPLSAASAVSSASVTWAFHSAPSSVSK